MNYTSTRDSNVSVSASRAIAQGLSSEGGLFVPKALPALTPERLKTLCGMTYVQRAADILADFLTDFTAEEVRECVCAAYGENFADARIAPLRGISPDVYMLELWHGPTCAFKDMALQLLPQLLTRSAKKAAGDKTMLILVATSGDTGKAALEGFADVPGTQIMVFYPHGGVSEIQRLQMVTQEGGNVGVCGVRGNFDDTQTAVKAIFTDTAMQDKLHARGMMFSSANSINWGRLAPQIVYYVSAYCDLVESGGIKPGNKLNIVVPTGNFGNILAAYYAKKMGLPVGRLVCASNLNNVLTDFICTGVYDKRRDFILTSSPSMDILVSSNLERLLHALYGGDDKAVAGLMGDLAGKGVYTVSDTVKVQLQEEFYGGFCSEQGTADAIRQVFHTHAYLCDTHTAVAWDVYRQYVRDTGDTTPALIASTANPYKFAGNVLQALSGAEPAADEFTRLEELSRLTGAEIPAQIAQLSQKTVRFGQVCNKEDMCGAVLGMLNL